jgi:hypothetical protein
MRCRLTGADRVAMREEQARKPKKRKNLTQRRKGAKVKIEEGIAAKRHKRMGLRNVGTGLRK